MIIKQEDSELKISHKRQRAWHHWYLLSISDVQIKNSDSQKGHWTSPWNHLF